MKIITAVRDGEVSVVSVKHGSVVVDMEKVGSAVVINQSGRGNVRFAKSQAKAIHTMLWG